MKKKKKHCEEKKRKLGEMEAEENRLYTKLQEYKERERAAQEKMKKALQYINDGHKKADAGLKASDMMQIEDGQNSATIGAKWQNEGIEELNKITHEKDKSTE